MVGIGLQAPCVEAMLGSLCSFLFTSYMYKFGSCILLTQLLVQMFVPRAQQKPQSGGRDTCGGRCKDRSRDTVRGRNRDGGSCKSRTHRHFADLVWFTTGGALPGGALQRVQGEGWRLQAERVQQPLTVPTHQAASCQHHNHSSASPGGGGREGGSKPDQHSSVRE